MRIVDERKEKTNLFEEVVVGQVFYFKDEEEYSNPHMRIFEIKNVNDNPFNAVDLQYGNLVYVHYNEPVILCNATLKIC